MRRRNLRHVATHSPLMAAAALTIAIFLIFFAVGLAALLLIRRDDLRLGEVLLAPVFGIAVFVIPTLLINQIGLPVGRFSLVEASALATTASFIIFRHRTHVPWRTLWAISPLFAIAFLLVGWPQLIYGFSWVSFSNNDMTNYSLAADRLVSHGFYALPAMRPDEIFRGYNPSYWFEYVLSGERTGVEMLLAVSASVMHIRGFQAFMSTIMAFNLSLIGCAAALGWVLRTKLSDAFIVGGLLAISPLTTLGTLYQLLAQVCGLAILTAQVVLIAMATSRHTTTKPSRSQLWILFGLLLSAQLVIYPELFPFAILLYFTAGILTIIHGGDRATTLLKDLLVVTGLLALFTLWNLPRMLVLLGERIKTQIPHGGPAAAHAAIMFPYFLLPSGMSSLWGFTTTTTFQGRFLSLWIALGMALTIMVAAYATNWALRFRDPASIMLCIMLFVGLVMFIKNVDFGTFKLAMYIQPFLLACFGSAVIFIKRFRFVFLAILALLIPLNLMSQFAYAETSFNGPYEQGASYVEVRDATTANLVNHLLAIEHSSSGIDAFISDTSNLVLGKYETGFVGSRPLFFLTTEFQAGLAAVAPSILPQLRPRSIFYDQYGNNLIQAARNFYKYFNFSFSSTKTASFMLPNLKHVYNSTALLHSGGLATVLNRSNSAFRNGLVYLTRAGAVSNDLVFIQSTLGTSAGIGKRFRNMSLFQVEPDYFYGNTTMSGIGRYLLFAALNPTRHVRMLLNISDTLQSNGSDSLPPAIIAGRKRVSFPLVGSGSARVVSPLVAPRRVGGFYILGLDMGRPGQHFIVPRTGLMDLYGRNIQIDPRLLTAFARNISLISNSEFAALHPPGFLNNLVVALRDPSLLYSGIYEDGWISNAAYLKLSTHADNESMIVNGLVPLIKNPNFHERLTCVIDGHIFKTVMLHVGYFHLKLGTRLKSGNHTVYFRFSRFERLPGKDRRPISARIYSVGFQ